MNNINFFENSDLDFLLFCMRYEKDGLDKIDLFRKNAGEESLRLLDRKNTYFYWDENISIDSLTSVNKVKDSNLYKETFYKITQTEEYKKYIEEKQKYKDLVEKYFRENELKIIEYLKACLKDDFVKLDENQLNFFICNPYCYRGQAFNYDNFAMFGNPKGIVSGDSNYELTYIIHECLHLLYPYKDKNDELEEKITHSIIELVSDYGLGQTLNGKPYQGHENLKETVSSLYSSFMEYLSNNEIRSLSEFINKSILQNEYALEQKSERKIWTRKEK